MTGIVKIYNYKGQEMGKILLYATGEREFQPKLNESEALALFRDLPARNKVHLQRDAYAVHKLLSHFGIDPTDYVENEDILIHIADQGYNSLTQLGRKNRPTWKLVKDRGLDDEVAKLFKEVKPKK